MKPGRTPPRQQFVLKGAEMNLLEPVPLGWLLGLLALVASWLNGD
jgi:hypothetical protein